MKRLVLFGIVIFLIIIGGFLVVDKVWLHKIFEIKPGSCLVLEEKYCKTGVIDYSDNKPMGIIYKVKNNTPLFSPITNGYTLSDGETNTGVLKKIFTVGNKIFKEKNIKTDSYDIIFDGDFVKNIMNDVDSKKINKGSVFGFVLNQSKKKNIEVFFIPTKTFLNDFGQIQSDVDEDKILKINNETKNK